MLFVLDFKKVFDIVSSNVLVDRLINYGPGNQQ